MQARGGRYFLREHPARAVSWKHRAVKAVEKMLGVVRVQGPMCRWAMRARGASNGASEEQSFLRKETRWLTNWMSLQKSLPASAHTSPGKESRIGMST